MPLTLPNLDDRTYADLVTEARSLIPAHAPEWTNHNASDPGITLIELFAYFTEMLLYRNNRVGEGSVQAFLRLLNGDGWTWTAGGATTLDDEVRSAVLALRRQERAITVDDFEVLARAVDPSIARARCLPRVNLSVDRAQDAPGVMSVLVVPRRKAAEASPMPDAALLGRVQDDLRKRTLLTTRVFAVGPRYVTVTLRLALLLMPDAVAETVQAQATAALQAFFDPLSGGDDGTGWPFGRALYASEIYRRLDGIPGLFGVDRVGGQDEVAVTSDTVARRITGTAGDFVGLHLARDELPMLGAVTFGAP